MRWPGCVTRIGLWAARLRCNTSAPIWAPRALKPFSATSSGAISANAVRVYRIYRAERREAAFTGEGAKIRGARWNLPGTRMVYTSSTLSLCLLEFFVHVDPEAVDIGQLHLEYRWAD